TCEGLRPDDGRRLAAGAGQRGAAVAVPGVVGPMGCRPASSLGRRALGPGAEEPAGYTAAAALDVYVVVSGKLPGRGGRSLSPEVETDFTRESRRQSRVGRSYELVESRLGGAGVWDVILPAPAQLDVEYLNRVRRLQQRLRSEIHVIDEHGQRVPG